MSDIVEFDNIDIDLASVDFGDFDERKESDNKKEHKESKSDSQGDSQKESDNQKESDSQKEIMKKLCDKYVDLGNDKDMEEIASLKEDRRSLCKRLETDPEFREKYIKEEDKKRKEDLNRILQNLTKEYEEEPGELPDEADTNTEEKKLHKSNKNNKKGTYVENMWVKKITVHYHFTPK